MNKQESDILNALLLEPFINQRILAEVSGHSLGVVNRSLKELIKAEYIHAEGPAFFAWLPKMFGKRVVVTVHGIDVHNVN